MNGFTSKITVVVLFCTLFSTLNTLAQTPSEWIFNLSSYRDLAHINNSDDPADTTTLTRFTLSTQFDIYDTAQVKNVVCSLTERIDNTDVVIKELNVIIRNIPSSTLIDMNSLYFIETNTIYFYMHMLTKTEARTLTIKVYNYSDELIQSTNRSLNF